MIKKLCIFTINFAYNRQIMLDFLAQILPEEVELFLFVPKNCQGKYHSDRIKIYESKQNKYFCFADFRKFCRKNSIDRIYSMGSLPQEGFLMAYASFFTKTKALCYLTVNPFTAYKTGFNKPAIKAFFEFLLLYPMILMTDKFYIPGKTIREKAKRTFPFCNKKIDFLPVQLDSDLFAPKNKKQCRKKLNLPLNRKIIMFVGRIEYEKGSDILLELMKLNPDILFILIGQIFDETLEKITLENLKILPPQSPKNLLDYYNSTDLCVFPSRSEAGPAVAREAMSCGTQVILPDLMGPRELCPPAIKTSLDIKEINNKIKEFFELSLSEKKKLAQKLRGFVIKDYSHQSCKNTYIDKLLK